MTDEQKTRLPVLKAMPDDRTDYGDAPWLIPSGRHQTGFPNLSSRSHRVLMPTCWHSSAHTGRYQTRIHAVLRSCVEAHKDECQMLH
ncbi:hypothetical protein BN439_pEA290029 (plasmid) [Erwinia amylovora Ea644]|nr:hypothetical protein BN439_pEA290029 [Erwinia amylovora Ea644]